MRKNPKARLDVDEVVDHFRWMSVIITGRYQELPNTPELDSEHMRALRALDKSLLWWQTAFAARSLTLKRGTPEALFYSIRIDSMTGLRAIPEAVDSPIDSPGRSGNA